MSIIRTLRGEHRSGLDQGHGFQSWLKDMIGGQRTKSGVRVNKDKALQLTAVYSSVKILSETVAHLPFPVYKRLDRGKKRDRDHPLYELLQNQANPRMTAFHFRETMMQHLLLQGNAFAEIVRNGHGEIVELWPLLPDKTDIVYKNERRDLAYDYQLPNGRKVRLSAHQVFHIPGMGYDGIKGYAPLELAKEAIGMGLATEEYGATFFENGGKPSGVLEHPNILNDDSANRMRDDWERLHNGLSNAHRVAILEQGTKYNQISVPPEQAQFLETRKFQTGEIARFFRVPPHMLGDLERATFSNIEQQSIDFVTHSITPWLKRWEQSVRMQLMDDRYKQTHMAEFVLEGLLRGDTASRYAAYGQARQNGWMSANDIRELENMNPVEGGDVYLVPMNMVPADKVYEPPNYNRHLQDPIKRTNKEDHTKDRDARSTDYQFSERQLRSLSFRSNIRDSNQNLLAQNIRRTFKKERRDVVEKARSIFESRDSQSSFIHWLSDYYAEEREDINAEMQPLMDAISEQVYSSIQDELGVETPLPEDVRKMVRNYVQQMARRISGKSFKALVKVIEENPDAIVEALESEFTRWDEERAESVARDEAVRSSGAITVAAYGALGVTTLVWVTAGSDACPYCQSLNGTTVGIDENFVYEGDTVAEDFTPSSNIGHPPLHEGCVCMIVSG